MGTSAAISNKDFARLGAGETGPVATSIEPINAAE